jgi:hypothetical protein
MILPCHIRLLAEILNKTDFIVIDTLAWEKSSVVPMSTSLIVSLENVNLFIFL